jgi:hypothetical protein
MSSSWLVKAVIGHHKTVGNKEVHADHQPLHGKPRHDGDVRLNRHDHKQISQLVGTGKDPNEVLHVLAICQSVVDRSRLTGPVGILSFILSCVKSGSSGSAHQQRLRALHPSERFMDHPDAAKLPSQVRISRRGWYLRTAGLCTVLEAFRRALMSC